MSARVIDAHWRQSVCGNAAPRHNDELRVLYLISVEGCERMQ